MERRLDVSLLEPPEPLERALESLKELSVGQYLHIYHRMEPLLLYPLLEKMEFNWTTGCDHQGMFHIGIWRRDDPAAQAEAQQMISECCRT